MTEETVRSLVARKPSFGLPTACPTCLPVYIFFRFAQIPFNLEFNLVYPNYAGNYCQELVYHPLFFDRVLQLARQRDQIPFIESDDYLTYNNEKGGVIQNLKIDGIAELDYEVRGIPEWVSMRAMVESWLADAVMYELWVGSDGRSANKIYYSDLPWLIGKVLYYKQVRIVKRLLGITSNNDERREEEIYCRATLAYGALSYRLGERSFFENRPTTLDAFFLGHVLFTVHALPESPVLRSKLLDHANLMNYAENLKMRYLDASSSSSSIPQGDPSSSKQKPSYWSSKPKTKPKKGKTEEEKKLRRRAKYFLATQLVAILVFLSIFGGHDSEIELEDDNDGLHSD